MRIYNFTDFCYNTSLSEETLAQQIERMSCGASYLEHADVHEKVRQSINYMMVHGYLSSFQYNRFLEILFDHMSKDIHEKSIHPEDELPF